MVFGDSGHRKAGPRRASADGVGESRKEGVLEAGLWGLRDPKGGWEMKPLYRI